jgi:hypothetical protein
VRRHNWAPAGARPSSARGCSSPIAAVARRVNRNPASVEVVAHGALVGGWLQTCAGSALEVAVCTVDSQSGVSS